MKVLFLGRYNSTEVLTGPEKVAKRIYKEFNKSGNTAFLEYFFDGRKYGFFKKIFSKKVIAEEGDSVVVRLGLLRILIFLIRAKPSIIHIITYERFALIIFIYKLISKVKIIYSVHGIIAHENHIHRNIHGFLKFKDSYCESIFLRYSDKIIFISGQTISIAEKYYQIQKEKIEIIPNGIDAVFSLIGKEKKYISDKPLEIIFVGDGDKKEKGFDFLIGCLNYIDFPVNVYSVGNRFIIEGNISKANPNQNINLTFLEKMDTEAFAAFMLDKDIYISPSSYEIFSIAAIEAMAEGLVPVVTQETGMSSYIREDENGFKFKYGDKERVYEILKDLNHKREKLRKISENAKTIYFLLSWEIVSSKYKELFSSLLLPIQK